MGGIFISYRRQDSSGHTGRLRDNLRGRFGKRVFQDVDGIADGEVFESVIDKALNDCEVALVVIGPSWLTSTDATGRRRLDDVQDWVRVEVRLLLKRGIRVIPVLVGGARMPEAPSLPDDMQALTRRQCRELRDTAWDADVAGLLQRLEEVLNGPAPPPEKSGSFKRWIVPGAIAIMVAGVALWWLLRDSAGSLAPPDAGVNSGTARDPLVVAAEAIGLPGTWRMESFSAIELPEGSATTYEMKAKEGEGVTLVPLDGKDVTMVVKQIKDRAVALTKPDVEGRPFEYMYVFTLSADGKELDNCATIDVADFKNLGPCEWRYHRVLSPSAAKKTRPDVTCEVKSADDEGCIEAARKVGLIGTWGTRSGDVTYRFAVDGKAVRLAATSATGRDARKFAVRSIGADTLVVGSTPFDDETEFDIQQTYAYDLTDDGSQLVRCRERMLLSTRTEESQCTALPRLLVRDSGK
jgi:hypothetical protein